MGMSRIFWDTNLYIYLIEGRSSMAGQVETLRSKMLARGDQLLTSTLTLGEVLVKPITMGDLKLSAVYQNALTVSSGHGRHSTCLRGISGSRSLHHQRRPASREAGRRNSVHRATGPGSHLKNGTPVLAIKKRGRGFFRRVPFFCN